MKKGDTSVMNDYRMARNNLRILLRLGVSKESLHSLFLKTRASKVYLPETTHFVVGLK